MTDEERAEVIDTFISIGKKFLKENKHFHLEPILARDIIQAIKELEKENAELIDKLNLQNQRLNWLKKEVTKLDRDKTELVNSVTELKNKITELEEKPKNNSYVQILQNEKAEMAEDFAKQIEKMKAETQIILEDNDTLNKWVDELREQIEKMKNFVKSTYEANKNDAYCREYLGTILNEWS